MMEKIVFMMALCLISSPTFAEEGFSIDEATFINMAEQRLEEMYGSKEFLEEEFSLLDINEDKKISTNEILQLALTQDTEEYREQLKEWHKKADANQNGALELEESKAFFKDYNHYLILQQFREKDKNNDGKYSLDDMPTPEENMKMLDETSQRIEEISQKMEQTSPEDLANNLMTSNAQAVADEDYFQMDKEQNNCVSKEAYATYFVEQQKNIEENIENYNTYDEFIDIYNNIPKADKDCLTKEEYTVFMQNNLTNALDFTAELSATENTEEQNKIFEEKMASNIYDEMDVYNNDCVGKESYVSYHTKDYDKHMQDLNIAVTEEDKNSYTEYLKKSYDEIEKEVTDCLSKEEFITDHLKKVEEMKKETEARKQNQ